MQRQQVGLILGLMAWCMQLVVFVQPFLPGHSAPGFGVCQIIIDAFGSSLSGQAASHAQGQSHSQSGSVLAVQAQQSQYHQSQYYPSQQRQSSQHDLPQHHLPPHQHAMADVVAGPATLVHTVDHHFSHLSCGFCTLYGHAIPPPDLQPFWSATALTVYVTLPRFYYAAIPALTPDYITPQSRAPPPDYIA